MNELCFTGYKHGRTDGRTDRTGYGKSVLPYRKLAVLFKRCQLPLNSRHVFALVCERQNAGKFQCLIPVLLKLHSNGARCHLNPETMIGNTKRNCCCFLSP